MVYDFYNVSRVEGCRLSSDGFAMKLCDKKESLALSEECCRISEMARLAT